MGNKVGMSEITDFSDDLQEASEAIRSQLDQVKESIETINGMNSFSGKAAKEAKQYFGELHGTILESFKGLFDDLEENLQQHIQTFESNVDPSDSTIIQSDYLQEVKEEINEVFEDLKEQDESIHDTIKDVSDISSATPPSFLDVDEWKSKTDRKIKELNEDLDAFTGEGDETDVKATMNQIEKAMNNAKANEGKARFADFEGASKMIELKKLQDYNENKKEEQTGKAEDVKKSTIKNLNNTSSKNIVNKVYQEFKDGDIGYDKYLTILDSVKNTSENTDKTGIEKKSAIAFIDYLEDHDMLDQYVKDNLDDKSSFYLKQSKEDYKNKDIDKATYDSIRSGVLEDGSTFIEDASENKMPISVSKQTKNKVVQWGNKKYIESTIVHKDDDPEHGYLIGEDNEFKYGTILAGAGYYENDWKKQQDQTGGTTKGSLIHVGGETDSDVVDGRFHQDLLKGEIAAKNGGSSVFGLNAPLPLIKAEGKAQEIEGSVQAGPDTLAEGWGIGGKGSLLKGKTHGGFDEGSIGFSAKGALAEGEGSVYVPIPFTDTEAKLTGGASAGSIGGEGKFGKEMKVDLRFLLGFKLGVKFE